MNPARTAAAASLALAFFGAAATHAEYLAYAVGKGARLPLPESVAGIDPHYLVELHWGYRGGRSTLSVMPVADASGAGSPSSSPRAAGRADAGAGVPLAAIHAVVVEALHRTGRFEVDGDPTGAAPDRARSDGHTLEVSVTTYESGFEKRVVNPRARRTQGAQIEKGRVVLRMRLVGPAGETRLVDQFEAVVEKPRPDTASAVTADGLPADLLQSSIGQALLAAVNKGVFETVKVAGPLPVSGRVVRAEEDRLWVNLGGGAVSVGDELEVTAMGEALVDPETGLDLGGVETTVATVRVVQVEERFSIAQTLSANGAPARGDRVRPTTSPAGFKFAPAWDPPGREAF
ncbi:MAG: hypothetical protein OXH09_05735 [Gammaproteobacteria bacterium]|nr:hypothetical protein [Gammaproteobacteria bacterium]